MLFEKSKILIFKTGITKYFNEKNIEWFVFVLWDSSKIDRIKLKNNCFIFICIGTENLTAIYFIISKLIFDDNVIFDILHQ